jgi:hypothetical protein
MSFARTRGALPSRFQIPVTVKKTQQTIPINARKIYEDIGNVSRRVKIEMSQDEVDAERNQWRGR